MVHIKNSHRSYVEVKQSDKVLLELATRAQESKVRDLLVELLNHGQALVQQAHESEEGQKQLQHMNQEPATPETSKTVQHSMPSQAEMQRKEVPTATGEASEGTRHEGKRLLNNGLGASKRHDPIEQPLHRHGGRRPPGYMVQSSSLCVGMVVGGLQDI